MGRWRNVEDVVDPREGCEATIANSPEGSSMTCVSFGLPVEDGYWQGEAEARVVASAPIEFTRGKGEIDSGVLTYSAMFQGASV
jgi:hypothetical protein